MTGHVTTGVELCWGYCCSNDVSLKRAMTDSVSCMYHDNPLLSGWTTGRIVQHVFLLCCEASLWVAFEASAILNQETKGQRWRHSYRACPSPSHALLSETNQLTDPKQKAQTQTRINRRLSSLTAQWHYAPIPLLCGKAQNSALVIMTD